MPESAIDIHIARQRLADEQRMRAYWQQEADAAINDPRRRREALFNTAYCERVIARYTTWLNNQEARQ